MGNATARTVPEAQFGEGIEDLDYQPSFLKFAKKHTTRYPVTAPLQEKEFREVPAEDVRRNIEDEFFIKPRKASAQTVPQVDVNVLRQQVATEIRAEVIDQLRKEVANELRPVIHDEVEEKVRADVIKEVSDEVARAQASAAAETSRRFANSVTTFEPARRAVCHIETVALERCLSARGSILHCKVETDNLTGCAHRFES